MPGISCVVEGARKKHVGRIDVCSNTSEEGDRARVSIERCPVQRCSHAGGAVNEDAVAVLDSKMRSIEALRTLLDEKEEMLRQQDMMAQLAQHARA